MPVGDEITFELNEAGTSIRRRAVSRLLSQLGLNRRRFLDPDGESNRKPQKIVAKRPGHMIHIDVKNVGRIRAVDHFQQLVIPNPW